MEQKISETIEPKKKNSFRELASYVFIALVIVIPVRYFIAQPFIVNGSSMDTTFSDGQYLIVDELSYRFNEPERLDVVVFKYPLDPKKYFIKRIIGLPGETVHVRGNIVSVVNTEHPRGFTLDEPYVHSQNYGSFDRTLGEKEYFVMGDNRLVSSDSRYWGALPRENITGKPFVRLLPFNKIGLHPGAIASQMASSSTVEIKQ